MIFIIGMVLWLVCLVWLSKISAKFLEDREDARERFRSLKTAALAEFSVAEDVWDLYWDLYYFKDSARDYLNFFDLQDLDNILIRTKAKARKMLANSYRSKYSLKRPSADFEEDPQ